MAEPDFIVPPPGLVPSAPETAAPDRTVRAAPTRALPPRALPSFVPGRAAPAAPRPPSPRGAAPAAPPRSESAAWRLVAASGAEIVIDGVLVLGRDPLATAGSKARAVAIDDPTRTVSKTHAVIEPAEEGVRVTDLRSTNGSRVEAPGEPLRELVAEQPSHVPVGAALYLGEFGLRVDRVVRSTV
ncbi:FHA domain-containing protein [Agromyces italicus]|uniref:FHA domain-containing protein n=1 Tax=Agromyces italicus TaxID=279572 RepID=UPI0003F526D5|nr:FHA domain-containing protein [Agromyces italicus]